MPINGRWKIAGQLLGVLLVPLLPASYGLLLLYDVPPDPTGSVDWYIGAYFVVTSTGSAIGSLLIALCAFRFRLAAIWGAIGGAGGLGAFLLLWIVEPKGGGGRSADPLAVIPLACIWIMVVLFGLCASFAAGLASLIKGYPLEEGRCSSCGYDLRGLPELRCPECGTAFDPAQLGREHTERQSHADEANGHVNDSDDY